MNILAIDIGGTTSRFAHFEPGSSNNIKPLAIYKIETQNPQISSFEDLLSEFSRNKTDQFPDFDNYRAIALSVPGPVYGDECLPPNIRWPINISSLKNNCTVFMLNDFAAQGYACMSPDIQSRLELIKNGQQDNAGTTAIIGAGTGLGHCTVVKNKSSIPDDYFILSSEAGHSTFSFIGEMEKSFEEFLCKKLKVSYCVNDHIVNGRGICLLHEFLTGEKLTAELIFSNPGKNIETINIFARFYARVCRNYCIGNMISNRLIISGGLAARNPNLVKSDVFLQEFLNINSASYQRLLENLPVYLNSRDDIGLIGITLYAKKQMVEIK